MQIIALDRVQLFATLNTIDISNNRSLPGIGHLPSRLSFLHSHGFSGLDEAHNPTRFTRASFSHCYV